MKKLSSVVAMRPASVLILLAIVVLLLPSVLIPMWYRRMNQVEHYVKLHSHDIRDELISQVESIAKLLYPSTSSSINLVTLLSNSFNNVARLSFSRIETMVAPMLFQALFTIPHLSQISYIGSDGLFYAFYNNDNQTTFAIFSNTSFSDHPKGKPNASINYTWYTQVVNRDTGRLIGKTTVSDSQFPAKESWFQQALNSTSVYSSLGPKWNHNDEHLVLNSVGMKGKAVLSLGFPLKELTAFFSAVDFRDASLYLATSDGEIIVDGLPSTRMAFDGDLVSIQSLKGNGDLLGHVTKVSCRASDSVTNGSTVEIMNKEYIVHCSPIDILGVQSVYVLAVPSKGLVGSIHGASKHAFAILTAMIVTMIVSVFTFVFVVVRSARREMHLCSALIKQMEATQQAERKNLSKIEAFAIASHDVRAALAGITGLIDLSYNHVRRGSDLESNLRNMDICAKDLLGLLNNILDTSKIEAGKMTLDKAEFNLAQLLEEVADIHHASAVKKGVEVILDLSDGSIQKNSRVKGDKVRLKQVLNNLLSNAVKFTAEGHVLIRAWAAKPTLENSILASQPKGCLNRFSCLFFKNNEVFSDLESVRMVQQDPNCMEFFFEVDDTGRGIPKDKHKLVFENYAQVKEAGHDNQGGTGLGLAIVQSLVRLMGGDIGIVDKELGAKGTCFKFNAFFPTCEANDVSYNGTAKEGDIESGRPSLVTETCHQCLGPSLQNSPKPVGSSAVAVLIRNDERRRIAVSYFENAGIKVSVIKKWESLHSFLMRMKRKMNRSRPSSPGKSDYSSSDCMSTKSTGNKRGQPLSSMDGTDEKPEESALRRANKSVPRFLLVLIDASAGPLTELSTTVADFTRGLDITAYKVVWLDEKLTYLEDERISANDVIAQPLHGSRLHQIIRVLPEFGGMALKKLPSEPRRECKLSIDKDSSIDLSGSLKALPRIKTHQAPNPEIQLASCSSSSRESSHSKKMAVKSMSQEDPISGKRVLLVEDNPIMMTIAKKQLLTLGASVEVCRNGNEALEVVLKGLNERNCSEISPMILPYDFILMDCEMPVMDGFEATRKIREAEKQFDVHIPIIALTAHDHGEMSKTMSAGMDHHLTKPIQAGKLKETMMRLGKEAGGTEQ